MNLPKNASESFRRRNAHLYGKSVLNQAEERKDGSSVRVLVINGQVRGGKNNMGISASGHHYPRGAFRKWRDNAIGQIKAQLPIGVEPFKEPINVRLDYIAGDRRRRDFPAICDAIWHVLEKACVVTDDTLLWPVESSRGFDKENPRVTITFLR